VAPVAVKPTPQVREKVETRWERPLPHDGVPRAANRPAPRITAKIPAISSRIAVPVPAGHGFLIAYGVLPEAQVPVSRSCTSLTLASAIPPPKRPSPRIALVR